MGLFTQKVRGPFHSSTMSAVAMPPQRETTAVAVPTCLPCAQRVTTVRRAIAHLSAARIHCLARLRLLAGVVVTGPAWRMRSSDSHASALSSDANTCACVGNRLEQTPASRPALARATARVHQAHVAVFEATASKVYAVGPRLTAQQRHWPGGQVDHGKHQQ